MSPSATEDYYATLGVDPRSEAAVIRSAYHALMHVYHPDKNDSPAAIERAHAIIGAFAVLGDSEKRLHYDWGRRRAAEAAAQSSRSWLSKLPRGRIATALALFGLVPILLMQAPLMTRDPPSAAIDPGRDVEAKQSQSLTRDAVAAPLPAPSPGVAVMPDTIVKSAKIEPRAADALPRATVPLVPAPAPRVATAPREWPRARKDARPEMTTASARTKCRLVKPGAEAAICNNDNLAALDRNVVAFYNQSLQFGAATNRGALLDSRNSFLARREACRSELCLQSVHLGHLRELSTIVEKRPLDPLGTR